ncbi:hypothetical protein CKM354_000173400 [Cercospora kikuchii]|uniref:Uncharacterized protein n=1 Tax=Cercospora kikuchii TaxID=84275 RepID=A0A9P3C8F4_9PEZI|nr:uncharacterized protein CKM354_000173400 [Cercospora kikuchii]GIZ38314.1 hypothetical protein CKM354_000173400 [Cercospora kikuchii]
MATIMGTSSERTSLTRPLRAKDMLPSRWEVAQQTGVMDSDLDDGSDALEGEELAEALARVRGRGQEKDQEERISLSLRQVPLPRPEQPSRRPRSPGALDRAMMTTGVFDDHTDATLAEFRSKQQELDIWKHAMLADGWKLPAGTVKVNWANPLAPSRPNWTDVLEWRAQKRAQPLSEKMETASETSEASAKVKRVDSLIDTSESVLPQPKKRKLSPRDSTKVGATQPNSASEAAQVRKAEAAKVDKRPKATIKLRNPKAKSAQAEPAPPAPPAPRPGARTTRTSVMGSATMKEKREAYLAKKYGV